MGYHNDKTTSAPISSANDLIINYNDSQYIVSGNVQINAIKAGKPGMPTLLLAFTGNPTVKHGTSGGAGTAQVKLAGSVDFVASPDSVLALMWNGSIYEEVSRKVPSGGNMNLTIYASDVAAGTAGLMAGDLYQTVVSGDGIVKIKQ